MTMTDADAHLLAGVLVRLMTDETGYAYHYFDVIAIDARVSLSSSEDDAIRRAVPNEALDD